MFSEYKARPPRAGSGPITESSHIYVQQTLFDQPGVSLVESRSGMRMRQDTRK